VFGPGLRIRAAGSLTACRSHASWWCLNETLEWISEEELAHVHVHARVPPRPEQCRREREDDQVQRVQVLLLAHVEGPGQRVKGLELERLEERVVRRPRLKVFKE
jgi:hypothetical protein